MNGRKALAAQKTLSVDTAPSGHLEDFRFVLFGDTYGEKQ